MNKQDFGEEYYEEMMEEALSNNYWRIHKTLASIFTPNVTLFLTILIDKRKFHKKENNLTTDGFFYETIEAMKDKINLSQREQETCIKILKGYGCIKTELKGLPAKRHFQLIFKPIHDLFLRGKSSETYLSCDKQVNAETHNCEITDSYEKEGNGSVYEKPLNLLSQNSLEQRTNNKNKSILTPKGVTRTTAERGCSGKIIKLREARKPLNIVDSSVPIMSRLQGDRRPKFSVAKKGKPTPITFDVQQIIDYWINKGLLGHEQGSGAFNQAVIYITKALNATLLESLVDPELHNFRNFRFTVDSIKKSIDNFYVAAYDDNYEPIKIKDKQFLRGLRLKDFLYNRLAADENKSHLFKYLSKRKLASESKFLALKDTHPFCTNEVKKWYHQEFGGLGKEVTRDEMNTMIQVGRKLEEFLVTHKCKLQIEDKMSMYGNYNPLNFLVGQLLRCASKGLRENDGSRSGYKLYYLISENMLGVRFVDFLRSERMIK